MNGSAQALEGGGTYALALLIERTGEGARRVGAEVEEGREGARGEEGRGGEIEGREGLDLCCRVEVEVEGDIDMVAEVGVEGKVVANEVDEARAKGFFIARNSSRNRILNRNKKRKVSGRKR